MLFRTIIASSQREILFICTSGSVERYLITILDNIMYILKRRMSAVSMCRTQFAITIIYTSDSSYTYQRNLFSDSYPIYFLETSVFIQYQRESVLDKSRNMLWNKERHLMIVMSAISAGYFTAIYL